MSKSIRSIAVAVAMVLGLCAPAVAQDKLFKDFAYDSPQKACTEAKGFYDCTDDVGATAMCKDDVDFIGQKFTLALVFSNAKLITVSLVSSFDQHLYASAVAALGQSFVLAAMSDGKTQLDLFELKGRSSSREDFVAKVASYEHSGTDSGDFTYTFFEGIDSSKAHSNMGEMLTTSATNLRCAELMLTGQDANTGVVVRFSFPNLEVAKVQAAAQKPVEAF